MAKGIIYIMTTSVKGLIKIGKTDNFKSRMQNLEQNGYWNVSGLHPLYAVKVDDYDKKEKLIHSMFSKSQVANSELFALDKHLAKELLESFNGEQVYPEISKDKNQKEPTVPVKTSIASRLTFEGCGIPVGSTLEFVNDASIKVKTVDLVNKVSYKGKTYTISGLAKSLTGSVSCQGGKYFKYKGKKLIDLRP